MRIVRSTLCGLAIVSATACTRKQPEPGTEPRPAPGVPVGDDSIEPTVTPISGGDAKALAISSNAFAFDVYARLRAAPGNSAFSPASISAGLAMLMGGARGETAVELRRTLHAEGDDASVFRAWGSLTAQLQDPSRKLTLRIANRLFGEHTATFAPAFLEATKAAFGASLERTNFSAAPEQARLRINQWVAARTKRRITNLLPPGSIGSGTRLALVNAIYFLAKWRIPFEPEATTLRAFSVSDTTAKLVATMRQTARFRIAKADGMTMLEMPYAGGDAAMLIVLPDAIDGLSTIESRLDAERFEGWRARLAGAPVDVELPKFTIDPAEPIALGDVLSSLAMKRAFDPALADFSGMAADRSFAVSELFHKAFIKVDEDGAEAAAATDMGEDGAAAPPPDQVVFRADHAFLYFVVDTTSGLILFMGRVTDPS
ncbi:MAG: serpin family protein [Kofleriaceae bacterium]